jgi:hypothetical protein
VLDSVLKKNEVLKKELTKI